MTPIAKVYDPSKTEKKWYTFWTHNRLFHADPATAKRPYVIVIPPPNVTGTLTMGHVLNNTLQDILIRFKKMQGCETLWMPGTDHASIATQNVVERSLAQEGKTRHDLGREAFVKRAWEWKEHHGGRIIEQLKSLGCACDWERERFTMDEGLSGAVAEAFVVLHRKGLIYRGKYIVNWCPRCSTALSDEESIHQDEQGSLWYIRYPVKGTGLFITVATTRPETMLGDTAVAVHPSDTRHRHLIGKTAILPVLHREIPIIAEDELVDPQFGTGAVKVTPAHDPSDFVIGEKHDLPQISVMNEDATMSGEAGPKYAGMDRFACRDALVQQLRDEGLLEKVEQHAHAVSHCQRCDTVVEPYLSDQWFVRTEPLAKPAIEAVQSGRLTFYPERWTKVYLGWLENIRDWCISRQLWWGHRIPVWYCECGNEIVAATVPTTCPACGSEEITQDEDVLDTWFSSALWPFSTMGWPQKTKLLDTFYPTNTLVTAPDLIFFWVAKMVMAGYEFMGACPFSEVYFHGMVRDLEGRKMSKSLGNSPDPSNVVAEYGADALRFTMAMLAPTGQDIHYADEKVEVGRNFANKVWNAARLVLTNTPDGFDPGAIELDPDHAELSDRWIASRLQATIRAVTDALDGYRFNDAANAVYGFLWHDYCDWYLELIKPRLYESDDSPGARQARRTAVAVLDGALRLLHPFMPFITEEIWQRLATDGTPTTPHTIMLASWPQADPLQVDKEAEDRMRLIQDVIGAIRNIRGEMNVPPGKKATALIRSDSAQALDTIRRHSAYVCALAGLETLQAKPRIDKPRASASAVVNPLEIFVPLAGLIDIDRERERLQKEIDRISSHLEGTARKLANVRFLEKAPRDVVQREQQKREDYQASLRKLQGNLDALA